MSRNQKRDKTKFLEALRQAPIIGSACSKAGVPRATIYKWRREDDAFAANWEEAIQESYPVVTDIALASLIKLLQQGNMSAIALTLTRLHPAFMSRDRLIENNIQPTEVYDSDPMPKKLAERLVMEALEESDREIALRAEKLAKKMFEDFKKSESL